MDKPEEAILFPDITVQGIKVTPWSFGMLFEIGQRLDSVLDKIEAKNVSFSVFTTGTISYRDVARLFSLASKEVLEIMSLTIGLSIEDIKTFDMQKGVEIAYTIFKQNLEVIKNALTPVIRTEIKEKLAGEEVEE